MKCVCGHEADKFPKIEVELEMIPEAPYGRSHKDFQVMAEYEKGSGRAKSRIYVCPDCGTLKLIVPKAGR